MVMNRAASSNSSTKDMPNMMSSVIFRSGALLDGVGMSLERKVWDDARLWAFL